MFAKPLVLPHRTQWFNSSVLQQTKINLTDWRWSGLSICFWREFAAEDLGLKPCALQCFCIEPMAVWRTCLNASVQHQEGSAVVQTEKTYYSELHRILRVRTVCLSSVLGILMTYLCGVLVLASSICWLMSQLASIMFFLLRLLIITLTFCPSEPLLMMLYFAQHDRLFKCTCTLPAGKYCMWT